MKQKGLMLLVCLLFIVALSACSGSTERAAEAPEPADQTVEARETPHPTPASTEEPVVETPEPFVPKGRVELEVDRLPKAWALEELGQAAEGEGTLTVRSDDLLVRYERDKEGTVTYYPVNSMGEVIAEDKYADVEQLLPGVYTVRAIAEGINNTGLLLESGEMPLPCEAAIISCLRNSFNDRYSERFLLVVYGTEETENEDEMFFYATSAMFSLSPTEDDVYYKGYAKIYDLKEQRFVPELTITNPDKYATEAGGDCFLYEDENGMQTVYSAAGDIIYQGDSESMELGDGFVLVDYRRVIDAQGEELLKSERYMNLLRGSGRFLLTNGLGDESSIVLDYFGNELFALPEGARIYSEGGGCFCGSTDEGGTLFDAQGELLATVAGASTPSYQGYGIWEFYSSDDAHKTCYYLANGTIIEAHERSAYNLVNTKKDEEADGKLYEPWNKPGELVTVTCSYDSRLSDALVLCSGKEAQLLDCFSGEILLNGKAIDFGNSRYIYETTDKVTTIYELRPEY